MNNESKKVQTAPKLTEAQRVGRQRVWAWLMLDSEWQMRCSQYWKARDSQVSGTREAFDKRERRDATETARARVYWESRDETREDIRQLHRYLRDAGRAALRGDK